jgi:AAA+ superfamily predicted ATPase
LQNEKEHLSSFLVSKLQVSVVPVVDKLVVKSEELSTRELQRAVTKFVYHRNFSNTHWVSIEGTTIKINRFKNTAKKTEKHKKIIPHQTAVQSWGL